MKQQNKDLTPREIMDSQAYQAKKYELFREINSNPMVIDFSVFKKSKEERAQLSTLKEAYKKGR